MDQTHIQELEMKMTFLERHIEEQDKVILKLLQTTDALEDRLKKSEDTLEQMQGGSNSQAGDERPPHY